MTEHRPFGDPLNALAALIVFAGSLLVYTLTLYPTVPFWDGGEYIASSAILGIPHPPGTPLYVLLGRVASLVPVGTIAERVNWLSALSSSVALLFLYLITARIAVRMFPEVPRVAIPGGLATVLLTGFCVTFWTNALEAEVYAPACALMALIVWLSLLWEDRRDDRLLLLVTYLVALGVAVHLGVALAAWAAAALVLTRSSSLRSGSRWVWAAVTVSLGFGMEIPGLGIPSLLIAPAVLLLAVGFSLIRGRWNRLAVGTPVVFLLGISVHLYLLLRAPLDPAINEGDPGTFHSLWLMLIRDQYKPESPLMRKADWLYQFDTMYLRYLWWNLKLLPGSVATAATAAPALVLAALGLSVQSFRAPRTALMLAVLFGLLGPLMVFYLNFDDPEVRERDYFFVMNIQFFTVWVGLGAAALVAAFRSRFQDPATAGAASVLAGVLVVGVAGIPLADNWREQDRSQFTVARNYAHNMLVPLEDDAILFTNGDNDTFPLWYLQEVEGVRKDVRVINLSLLNTGWYLRQLRDYEPQVPIAWTDSQIATLPDVLLYLWGPYNGRGTPLSPKARAAWPAETIRGFEETMRSRVQNQGKGVFIKDLAVDHILDSGSRPGYLAVTVPDVMGLEPYLSMEGLVFRIHPEPVERPVDVEIMLRNLYEVFEYDGLVTPDPDSPPGVLGVYDERVYKDANATKLSQNYAAAFGHLSNGLRDQGRYEEALTAIRNAEVITPEYVGIAYVKGMILESMEDWPAALEHYRKAVRLHPREGQLHHRLGATLVQNEQPQAAVREFERSIALDPRRFESYNALLSLYYAAQAYEDALGVLEKWLAVNPDDAGVRRLYEELRESIAGEEP